MRCVFWVGVIYHVGMNEAFVLRNSKSFLWRVPYLPSLLFTNCKNTQYFVKKLVNINLFRPKQDTITEYQIAKQHERRVNNMAGLNVEEDLQVP